LYEKLKVYYIYCHISLIFFRVKKKEKKVYTIIVRTTEKMQGKCKYFEPKVYTEKVKKRCE